MISFQMCSIQDAKCTGCGSVQLYMYICVKDDRVHDVQYIGSKVPEVMPRIYYWTV